MTLIHHNNPELSLLKLLSGGRQQRTTMTQGTNHDSAEQESQRRCCLWIGGTSALARTFFNAYYPIGLSQDDDDDDETMNMEWILLGHEQNPPHWIQILMDTYNHHYNHDNSTQANVPQKRHGRTKISFVSMDLTNLSTNNDKDPLPEWMKQVDDVIVGIRPPLVSHKTFVQAWQFNAQLLHGLQTLLQRILRESPQRGGGQSTAQQQQQQQRLVHISSVAAIHHVQEHVLRSETNAVDPSSDELDNPYDRFKRATEELVEEIMQQSPHVMATSVRLGAIFSDDVHCIQCRALALQARVGCYLPTKIDCNSSRNVATLLHQLLCGVQSRTTTTATTSNPIDSRWRPVYYYTRPTRVRTPVPYGSYLADYRKAYDITWAAVWIPVIWVRWFVAAVQACSNALTLPWLQRLDRFLCLSHVNYLLQVTVHEHSFDLTAIQTDFPQLTALEESIQECFQRRRKWQWQTQTQ